MAVGGLRPRRDSETTRPLPVSPRVAKLQQQLRRSIGFEFTRSPKLIRRHDLWQGTGYRRQLLEYKTAEGHTRQAFLLLPEGAGPFPAVLGFQYVGARPSRDCIPCRDASLPLSALGPSLAQRGVCVLVPEVWSVPTTSSAHAVRGAGEDLDTLRDAETAIPGTTTRNSRACSRLLSDRMTAHQAVQDAKFALQLFSDTPAVDAERVGIFGHAVNANAALVATALFPQIRYACVSALAFSGTCPGVEPSANDDNRTSPAVDLPTAARCLAPRRILLLSSDEDTCAGDCDAIFEIASESFAACEHPDRLMRLHTSGAAVFGHVRRDAMLCWLAAEAQRQTPEAAAR